MDRGREITAFGLGQILQTQLNAERILVSNQARGGAQQSDLSDGGAMGQSQETLKKGDIVFIQFGHNDGVRNVSRRPTTCIDQR